MHPVSMILKVKIILESIRLWTMDMDTVKSDLDMV